jgi:uncharacterized protein YggE
MTQPSSRRLAAALFASALALPLTTPAHAEDSNPREARIVVSGEAQSAIAPDLAIVALGVTETRKTAREALSANNASMAAVLKALKADGMADKDLQTSGFSIQPDYSYPQNEDGTPKPPVLNGYTVSNMLSVRIRDLSKVGAVLDTAVTLGVNQGGDIRFTNLDPQKAIAAAREGAMKDAIAKARTLADSAGVALGRVVEISESTSRPEPVPMVRMAMAKEAADAVPVASGENSYAVTVNVTFAIQQ